MSYPAEPEAIGSAKVAGAAITDADMERVRGLYQPTIDGERLIHVFKQLVDLIGGSLPSFSEVVLHDLSRLPNSVVAVSGNVTGRKAGSPATDRLLRAAVAGQLQTSVGDDSELPDGRRVRSSTMVIRDVSDRPVAALCINSDITVWQAVRNICASMLGTTTVSPPQRPPAGDRHLRDDESSEVFVWGVGELAEFLLQQAVSASGVPVDLMHKRHKIDVVRTLKARGLFLLRDAVETVAAALHVTRFTIYNYLSEITDSEDVEQDLLGPGVVG